jgi:C4-dicarboxylate-binding protein DctP
MSKPVRARLGQIIDEATLESNTQVEALDDKAKQDIIADGKSELLVLIEVQRNAWRGALRSAWKRFEAEVGFA